jgi:hypothetical protein
MTRTTNFKTLALALATAGILTLGGSDAKAQGVRGGSPQRSFAGNSKNFFPGGSSQGFYPGGGWGQPCYPYPCPQPYPYPFPKPYPYPGGCYPGGGYPSGGWGGGFPGGSWGGYGGMKTMRR